MAPRPSSTVLPGTSAGASAAGLGDSAGECRRGLRELTEHAAEGRAVAHEVEAGERLVASRQAALVEDAQVADERLEAGAEAGRGDDRVRRDARAVREQHLVGVEPAHGCDDLDPPAPHALDEAD